MTNVLTQLVDELNAGRVRVVDLTQPLDAETPVIGLPPIFAPSCPPQLEETVGRLPRRPRQAADGMAEQVCPFGQEEVLLMRPHDRVAG